MIEPFQPRPSASGGQKSVPTRRTAWIIWWALVVAVVVFAAVATAMGPRFWASNSEVADILAFTALGMALVELVASRLLPRRMKPQPGTTPDAVGVTRTIIASAINAGAALFALVTWMVGGRMLSLVALAVSLVGLLLAFPSPARWPRLCGQPETATRPNRMIR